MDTELLKSFLILARIKNFTRAAELLSRSQSAISLQIGKLEEMVGKRLFSRDQRNVSLTLEGEQFLGYAQEVLRLEEEMMNHFHKPSLKGEVKFGTPEDLATAYLPSILSDFAKIHPDVVLNVDCRFTVDLLNGFASQAYDLILIKQDPRAVHPSSEQVWKEPLVWVYKKNVMPSCFFEKPLPLILAPQPCVYRERAIDALNKAGIRWRIVYTSPSLAGTLAAVKAGLGVSVLPMHMVPKELSVIENLPALKDAQIAILKQPNSCQATTVLASFVKDHIYTARD